MWYKYANELQQFYNCFKHISVHVNIKLRNMFINFMAKPHCVKLINSFHNFNIHAT